MCYQPRVDRADEIAAITRRARALRKRNPRWLWIAAAIVGVICIAGFAVVMLADRAPRGTPGQSRAPAGSGLGIGLAIGGVSGLAIGAAVARQRRDHSSRNNP
jgi:drug/metabolite transporter (DMT)-like permease